MKVLGRDNWAGAGLEDSFKIEMIRLLEMKEVLLEMGKEESLRGSYGETTTGEN